MHIAVKDFEIQVAAALERRSVPEAAETAWACAWLEACGYPGLKLLAEALDDPVKSVELVRDAIGFDLANVSCVFLAPGIMRDVTSNGRVFLRNVRHGLYMLPFTVRANAGIGCPVDPAFAVGGERHKNPYAEKVELAEAHGIEVDETLLRSIA